MNTVDRIPFNKKIDLSNYNVIIFPYDEDMNPIDEFYINNNIGRDKLEDFVIKACEHYSKYLKQRDRER